MPKTKTVKTEVVKPYVKSTVKSPSPVSPVKQDKSAVKPFTNVNVAPVFKLDTKVVAPTSTK